MESKNKMTKERSEYLHKKRKEKNQKKNQKKESSLARLKKYREAQQRKKRAEEYRAYVPEGLNRATMDHLLGVEVPKEEKPKEVKPQEEKPAIIIAPPSPVRDDLRKERRIEKKEVIRKDLSKLWGAARQDLINQREEACLDIIRCAPEDLSREEREKYLLGQFKSITEDYNEKYRAEIARINRGQKEIVLKYYELNGQGPKKKTPSLYPPLVKNEAFI